MNGRKRGGYGHPNPNACLHELYDHVIYDRNLKGYRTLLRCRCGLKELVGKRLFKQFVVAEAKSKELLSKAMKK